MLRSSPRVRKLAQDDRGTTAIIFAVASMLVFGAIGLSIDGARVYAAQQRLQHAVDGAVLAAARRAALDGMSPEVKATFDRFFEASPAARDVTFTSATITARGALIYNTTEGAGTGTTNAVVVLDFGADKTSTSGDFQIVFPTADASNAIIRIA